MINYINSYIPNEAPYAEEHPTDVEDMILSFKIACRDYGPPIIRMMSSSYSDWPYSTDYIGHYLNVSGAYRTNGSYTFELTDPYIGYVSSSTTGKYTKSAQAVYDVIMEHWFHGYWW